MLRIDVTVKGLLCFEVALTVSAGVLCFNDFALFGINLLFLLMALLVILHCSVATERLGAYGTGELRFLNLGLFTFFLHLSCAGSNSARQDHFVSEILFCVLASVQVRHALYSEVLSNLACRE